MVIKCEVKNCERQALMAYGSKWICGDCFMKIHEKEIERKNKLVEELELDD